MINEIEIAGKLSTINEKKLIERQRKVIREIFADTAYTNVDNEKEVAFLNSSIRFDDDIVLKDNKIEAEKLLDKYVWN